MKIYFAGSIRGGRDDQNIYFELIKILSQYGTVLTEHVGRADLTARGEDALSDKYIYERDIEWIEECDFVVAEVTKVSLGVGYEIGYAESKAKKILCLYRELEPGKKISAMLLGNHHLKLKKYVLPNELTEFFKTFFADENKN